LSRRGRVGKRGGKREKEYAMSFCSLGLRKNPRKRSFEMNDLEEKEGGRKLSLSTKGRGEGEVQCRILPAPLSTRRGTDYEKKGRRHNKRERRPISKNRS